MAWMENYMGRLSSVLSQKRRGIYYVPWLSVISFIIVLAGTITWGVGTALAVKNLDLMTLALRANWDPELSAVHKVAAVVIVLCCVLAAGMLAMSGGRSCTEYAVDARGQPTRGSPCWLAASVFSTILWWIILVLLMFVFFTCVLAAAFVALFTAVLQVVAIEAPTFFDMGIKYRDQISEIMQALLGPLPYSEYDDTDVYCPSTCLPVELVQYFAGRKVCICSADAVGQAFEFCLQASNSMTAVVVGSFLVWVGASFLLMNATADFAQSRRERVLLMRLRKAALATDGGVGDDGGIDGFGAGAATAATGSGFQKEQQQQQQQQQARAQAPDVELIAAAKYGAQSSYGNGGDGGGFGDVDKVPLLMPQMPYRKQSYDQHPYGQQMGEPTYGNLGQPGALAATERSEAGVGGKRQDMTH